MKESIKLFGQICTHPSFEHTNMILFMNKKDLFSEKLNMRPITVCFPEYMGPNRYKEASIYVWSRFENVKGDKILFSHVTCATDTKNLKLVFIAVSDMLVKSILSKIGIF